MEKIIKEEFNSIHQMLSVIGNRPNNKVMRNQHASETNGKDFTGTASYKDAVDLFQNGYTEILPKIKNGMAKILNLNVQNQPRRRIQTGIVGYAPHVPNAILGLPNSMILTESQPQKIKAISIVYSPTQNCMTDAKEFVKCGIVLLSIIQTLELRGIRVNLKIMFYCAECGTEYVFPTIKLKDYREHMDIQKLCFPLAHPSMFRRFGFKWLETIDGIKNNWDFGYGRTITDYNDPHIINQLSDNEYFMNLKYIKDHDYSVDKIIQKMNIR